MKEYLGVLRGHTAEADHRRPLGGRGFSSEVWMKKKSPSSEELQEESSRQGISWYRCAELGTGMAGFLCISVNICHLHTVL